MTENTRVGMPKRVGLAVRSVLIEAGLLIVQIAFTDLLQPYRFQNALGNLYQTRHLQNQPAVKFPGSDAKPARENIRDVSCNMYHHLNFLAYAEHIPCSLANNLIQISTIVQLLITKSVHPPLAHPPLWPT